MLRYIITFPPGADITPADMAHFREMLSKAANAREWRDLVLAYGCTIKDVRQRARPRYSAPKPR